MGKVKYGHRNDAAKCAKKNGYDSARLAEQVAANRMKQNPSLRLQIYRCSICEYWHLTSKPMSGKRKFIQEEAAHWEKKLGIKIDEP